MAEDLKNQLNINNQRSTPLYNTQLGRNQVKNQENGATFIDLLQQLQKEDTAASVKISSHAQKRIQSREIQFDSTTLKTLDQVLEIGTQKGSKSTLVMAQNQAFILSIKDRTLVTALKQEEMNEYFFTNIDSVFVSSEEQ
jgi:flagellar operon protein